MWEFILESFVSILKFAVGVIAYLGPAIYFFGWYYSAHEMEIRSRETSASIPLFISWFSSPIGWAWIVMTIILFGLTMISISYHKEEGLFITWPLVMLVYLILLPLILGYGLVSILAMILIFVCPMVYFRASGAIGPA
jgi:hypothetical protein